MESVSSLGQTFICRKSSMNMTINNRYCNRFIHVGRLIFSVNRSGASVYNPDDIWEYAYAVLHSRGTAHPICDPSRIIAACCRALNSSMLWLFHEAITCPIIVFTSSPTCFAGTNSIAIDLMTAKDRFFFSIIHQRQSAISSCCDQMIVQWLAFHVLQKICHMKIFVTIDFYIWT